MCLATSFAKFWLSVSWTCGIFQCLSVRGVKLRRHNISALPMKVFKYYFNMNVGL